MVRVGSTVALAVCLTGPAVAFQGGFLGPRRVGVVLCQILIRTSALVLLVVMVLQLTMSLSEQKGWTSRSSEAHKEFFPFSSSPSRPFQLPPLMATKGVTDKKQKDAEVGSDSARQLLGMKGASETDDLLKIRIQLMKPVTWIPLIWGVVCGAAASGNYHWFNPFDNSPDAVPLSLGAEDLAKSVVCMLLAGPLLTGYTQTINDWYDREIDAINEPYRPIPSGRISEGQVIAQIWALLLGGLVLAYGLDVWAGHETPTILGLSLFGSFISYIYSAPPLKLKQSGWIGNYALGCSYISLPWWCGQAMFGTLSLPVVVLTVLYSLAGLGIAIVNDFKSIEGDRAMGLQSLPVAFGVDTAKWICASTIDVTQLGVAGYLAYQGQTTYAAVLLGLILPQMYFQSKYLLVDPIEYDVKYQASAQPFLVIGILVTALAVGHAGGSF